MGKHSVSSHRYKGPRVPITLRLPFKLHRQLVEKQWEQWESNESLNDYIVSCLEYALMQRTEK
jgi:predicted HicB family RNase H-like nuclease